jgi:hypothetical protein
VLGYLLELSVKISSNIIIMAMSRLSDFVYIAMMFGYNFMKFMVAILFLRN